MQSSKLLRKLPETSAGRRSRRKVTLLSGRSLLTTFTARPFARLSSPHPFALAKIQMLPGKYSTMVTIFGFNSMYFLVNH